MPNFIYIIVIMVETNAVSLETIFLSFLNWILLKINMPSINKITDFQKIDRELLTSIDMELTESEWSAILFVNNGFDKPKLNYYNKKIIKNYILSILKLGSKHLGYKFNGNHRRIQKEKAVIYTCEYSIN